MSFDYSTSGLPENGKWQVAAEICHGWLSQHMTMFGPERITNFMHNQPVSAAKRIMNNCDSWSEESVTLVLLGPAKDMLIATPEKEDFCRKFFGDRTIELLKTLIDPKNAVDADMARDANRIFIAEGVSTMSDQMIGRQRIDAHHQTRWNILNNLEQNFAQVKGVDPRLDAVFEDAMAQSKDALTKLDQAAAAKKAPKPPGM